MKISILLTGLLLAAGVSVAQQYNVSTVAGMGGSAGWSGDGGPALSAQFTNPIRVAVDKQGNLFITDYSNQSIRRVDHTTSVVTTTAGNGLFGYAQDGASSSNSQLADPHDVVVDAAGNVYIADTINGRVREVTTDGNINTIAGNGTHGWSGDNGAATNAQLWYPAGLALDGVGNLYIADYGNATVRRVDKNGIITTIAGRGFIVFGSAPGDGGPATSAFLEMPYAVQSDATGNVYIGDIGTSSIRRVGTDGKITTVAQNFVAQNFAIDATGAIYYADYQHNTVVKILPGGTKVWIGGNGVAGFSGDYGPGTSAQFSQPYGVAVDAAGDVFVADSGNAVIRELTPVPFSIGAVANAASIQSNAPPVTGSGDASDAIAPGEIVVLFANGLGPATLTVATPSGGFFPKQVAGTTVTINGTAAPLIYASSSLIAAIVPYSVSGLSSATVSISYQGKTSPTRTLPVQASAPGIFTADASGSGQIAAINQDQSLNSAAHPAPVGSIIAFYVTGEGQTAPAGVDGKIALSQPYTVPLQNVSVTVGGLPASIAYAGGAPSLVAGAMQINVQIPSGVAAGSAVQVQVQIGGVFSQLGTIVVSAQ